jgi:hypothetical protein
MHHMLVENIAVGKDHLVRIVSAARCFKPGERRRITPTGDARTLSRGKATTLTAGSSR